MKISKRFQVFVSSTYTDLVSERREIIQALLELDCIPSGMELFQAADEDSWSLIKSVIDDCDYYIVVVAGRYGSMHPETGISYTEMEYRYATERNIPVIAFLHQDVAKLSSAVVDTGEQRVKLDAFRELCQKKQVKFWESAPDLGSAVSRSLVRLIKERPAIGWVKADTIASDEAREQLLKMKEEIENLKRELNSAKSSYQGDISLLAQGDDPIDVTWIGSYRRKDANGLARRHTVQVTGEISINVVFKRVAPAMVDEISESHFRSRVDLAFSEVFGHEKVELEYASDNGDVRERFASALDNVSCSDDSFQTLKVQLMALNLIMRGDRKRSATDRANYWKITPEGETKMMSLLAIKRNTMI